MPPGHCAALRYPSRALAGGVLSAGLASSLTALAADERGARSWRRVPRVAMSKTAAFQVRPFKHAVQPDPEVRGGCRRRTPVLTGAGPVPAEDLEGTDPPPPPLLSRLSRQLQMLTRGVRAGPGGCYPEDQQPQHDAGPVCLHSQLRGAVQARARPDCRAAARRLARRGCSNDTGRRAACGCLTSQPPPEPPSSEPPTTWCSTSSATGCTRG